MKKKEVYTFRKKPRKVGRDWATDHYGGKKIADVDVTLIAEMKAIELYPYRKQSGFKKFYEWILAIKSFGMGSWEKGYLYEVRKCKRIHFVYPRNVK